MKRILILSVLIFAFCCVQGQNLFPQSAQEDIKKVMGEDYWEQWNSELQDEIDRNIDKNRKADALIKLTNIKPGTKIKIQQLSHDFQFGANIFNFDQLGSDDCNGKYKDLFGTLFNSATLAFYWKNFEPVPGCPRYLSTALDDADYWNNRVEPWKEFHWRRPAPEKIIEFCEDKGIHIHGHPIIWGSIWQHPTWISKEPEKVNRMEALFEQRIRDIAEYYKDRIPSWDVVNESVDPVPGGKPRYGIMPEDYTYKSYKIAEEVFPDSVLLNINDSWRPVYPPFIKDLISRGAKIDVVGLQMHIFKLNECLKVAEGREVYPNRTSWQPLDVINYLNVLDSLGRPIHLSEVTIPAPGTDEKSQEIQAIILQNMYRLWFSWPSIYKITWWNVVDDCGASGEPTKSGLFTRNMKPKASYYAMDNLINRVWITNLNLKADRKGNVKFRGFKGKYRITWTDKSGQKQVKEFYLKHDGDGF